MWEKHLGHGQYGIVLRVCGVLCEAVLCSCGLGWWEPRQVERGSNYPLRFHIYTYQQRGADKTAEFLYVWQPNNLVGFVYVNPNCVQLCQCACEGEWVVLAWDSVWGIKYVILSSDMFIWAIVNLLYHVRSKASVSEKEPGHSNNVNGKPEKPLKHKNYKCTNQDESITHTYQLYWENILDSLNEQHVTCACKPRERSLTEKMGYF